MHRFQSLQDAPGGGPSRDLSALPRDYERREALERAAKSRSIGLVDVPELQGAQNLNSGGLEAAILDTFNIFGGLEPPPARDILIFNFVLVGMSRAVAWP